MKKIGDYVIYQKEVYKITEMKENDYTKRMCYTLIPLKDKSLKVTIPIDNQGIQNLMTKEELNQLIKRISAIPVIKADDKLIENEYKRLLSEGKRENLIAIIKTTYLRNQQRKENNKKISEKDNRYFQLAEEYLYTEVSVILNCSIEEAKDYIIKRVE
ncbi:MAG: hypothetical protein IJ772_00590 [Bacilli bacterium]|nr:hypothetical protein [Bacilli bacterium]MBR1817325.1 hypothetical protein [Bacilli bacterium]